MASIGHVAVGLAAARSLDPSTGSGQDRARRWPSMIFWSALALLPDIDVVGFMRGVPYSAEWGHRGATHSLSLALAGAVATGLAARALGARGFRRPALLVTLAAIVVLASHGLLDSMTDGGLGIALAWPFSRTRFWAPWRPIPVAPIGPDFFTPYGAMIGLTEVGFFAPLLLYALWPRTRRLAPAALAAFVAIWGGGVWLIGSDGPVRERLLSAVFHDDTRFALGYSEDAFRAIALGDPEKAVRARIGEPLNESLYYRPPGAPALPMMEVGVERLPRACLGARLENGVVTDTAIADICRRRGIVIGISKADVLRLLGEPTESCAEYSTSPSQTHFRVRMVCFLGGKVELVFRRWA